MSERKRLLPKLRWKAFIFVFIVFQTMTVGQYGRLMNPEDAGIALSNIIVMEAYLILIALVMAVFFAIMPKVGFDLEKQVEEDRRE